MEKSAVRIGIFDVLKTISIIFVIITHLPWSDNQRRLYGFPFGIAMAVPVFLLISGYVLAQSLEKSKPERIGDIYSKKYILKSVFRYTFPFAIIYFAECIFNLVLGKYSGWRDFFYSVFFDFFSGGYGPGSYYFPLLIALVFVFPIIYSVIKKYRGNGLLLCFAANILYEILKISFQQSSESYRILIFRHIFVIAFGCYFYLYGKAKLNKIFFVFFVIGTFFITAVEYLGYKPLIFMLWSGTSLPASLYIIPIFAILVSHAKNIGNRFTGIVGKATYNIFLVQMVYYEYFYPYLTEWVGNILIELILSLLICLTVGIVINYAEKPVVDWFLKHLSEGEKQNTYLTRFNSV